MADKETEKTPKEPFVSQADRPDVSPKADTPLSDLTVRDLAQCHDDDLRSSPHGGCTR